jgi:hypothetical protein
MNAWIPSRGRDTSHERSGELGFAADSSGTRLSAAKTGRFMYRERTQKQHEPTPGRLVPILVVALSLGVNSPLFGQAFDSGSNGSYGALNVTTDTTLDMPSDGVFHCTTITVASGATLKFKKNSLNTPVYLLATGDVMIQGTIDVSGGTPNGKVGGFGGPGGFDGGFGAFAQLKVGQGQGPGGGGNVAVFAIPYGENTNTYGNSLLIPLIGGSGGGGIWDISGGCGGGGAVLVASSTRAGIEGKLDARGPYNGSFAASGGAIRIVAPLVQGAGTLDASGIYGNDGRVRIDSPDRYAYRNLHIFGLFAGGANMIVFPPGIPRLDIISAAGTAIPEATNSAVSILLAAGSSTNQIVRVQARGFTNDVPIRVKVTPENGPAGTFDSVVLLSNGNPPYADVNVNIVPEIVCRIHAWTR